LKEVNGVRTNFFYSDEGLIGEYDSTGSEIKTYRYAPNSTWTTNPLFQKIGSNYYWYQNDHLGTPQKVVDASGRVVWSATYHSFGKAQIQVSEIENNLRFPGQYYDQETGLHYNWNRYYDPKTGRYLTPDLIGLEGGINLWPYAQNSPVTFGDPFGE
jgi:RHS repeat-associated protein